MSLVPNNLKEAYLIQTLKTVKLKETHQIIIFVSTCRKCHFLAMLLAELDFEVTMIHS